jgi:hypothetical protein
MAILHRTSQKSEPSSVLPLSLLIDAASPMKPLLRLVDAASPL